MDLANRITVPSQWIVKYIYKLFVAEKYDRVINKSMKKGKNTINKGK